MKKIIPIGLVLVIVLFCVFKTVTAKPATPVARTYTGTVISTQTIASATLVVLQDGTEFRLPIYTSLAIGRNYTFMWTDYIRNNIWSFDPPVEIKYILAD